ncbi:MAG: nitronate monooxygenase [Candidatus Abyssubacteria bacterium]
MNPVTEMLGCKYPIIQGAMAGISNPELVAAVSEAGGYGLLAAGSIATADELRRQIERTRKLTDKPFGANLLARGPKSPEYIDILAEYRIRAVTTSAGPPEPLAPLLHERGIRMIHVVPTAALAVKAERAGADAVVAEGTESGGLQGLNGVTTMTLVPAVVDAVKIPVIAAGGIADSRGYRAAFALGAVGVQVGTAFMAASECIIHENAKRLLIEASETDTVLLERGKVRTRVILTPFVEQYLKAPSEAAAYYRADWHKAAIEGDVGHTALLAGQCVGLIRKVRSAKEIIDEMVS